LPIIEASGAADRGRFQKRRQLNEVRIGRPPIPKFVARFRS
jgi:hypothetical protein